MARGSIVSAWALIEYVLADLVTHYRLSEETVSVLDFLNLLTGKDDIVLIGDLGLMEFVSNGLQRSAAAGGVFPAPGGDHLHTQGGIKS